MTAITLEAFIRKLSQVAEEQFIRRGGLVPTFIGDRADGTRIVRLMNEAPDKDAADAMMRQIAIDEALVRCCFVYEGWALDGRTRVISDAEPTAMVSNTIPAASRSCSSRPRTT